MSNAKIRIKVGPMELEYEGEPSFLTGGIEALLTTMGDLSSRIPFESIAQAPISTAIVSDEASIPTSTSTFSTNTIAAHFNAKTGPELIVCAMAQLELVQGKSSSTRKDILAEMKLATTYYNASMSSNLTRSLDQLTKARRINQTAKDTYALNATERKQVEAKVAEIG